MNASANQGLTQATALQPIQNCQSIFHQPPNDTNFYHVTCKMIIQENLVSWEDDYDYVFSNASYYITCKLLSHSLIVDILNKEIYGRDFDIDDLKRKYVLTSDQKFNLKLSLQQQILPFYLHIHERPDSNENASSLYGNVESNTTQAVLMIDDQSYFDSVMSDSQDINGIAYPQQFFSNHFDTSF